MSRQILYFENNKIELSTLVNKLEELLHSIEEISYEWEDKFLNEFSILESINAEIPKMKRSEIEKLIKETISNLKRLIQELLI